MAESWQFSKDCLDADLQAAAGRQVARRQAVHRRGRALHLPGHDQSEDPDGLQGRLRARQGRRRSLDPVHGAGHLRPALRQGAWRAGARAMLPKHLLAEVRRGGQAPGVAPEQPSPSAPVRTGSRSGRAARRSCWSPTRTTTQGRPYLGRIVYRVIPSQATIFLELKAKGVDYARSSRPSSTRARPTTPRSSKAYHKYRYSGERATPTSAST